MSKINIPVRTPPPVSAAVLRPERLRLKLSGVDGLATYPPGATFGPRTLKDFEFVWIIDGQVRWECNGAEHPAPPGTIILSRPGTREMYRWDPQRQTRHAFFHFTAKLSGCGLPPIEEWPTIRQMPGDDVARPLFRHIVWLRRSGRADAAALAENAARQLLLAFVCDACQQPQESGPEYSEPVQRALRFAVAHLERHRAPPTLGELALAAAVTPGHLCRLFRAEFGCGPVQALRLARIDRAAALLARTNLPVKEIAGRHGFESPFHFSRCFKAVYGTGPREFRRRAAQGLAQPASQVLSLRRVSRAFPGAGALEVLTRRVER